jgi:hypothetical protein
MDHLGIERKGATMQSQKSSRFFIVYIQFWQYVIKIFLKMPSLEQKGHLQDHNK